MNGLYGIRRYFFYGIFYTLLPTAINSTSSAITQTPDGSGHEIHSIVVDISSFGFMSDLNSILLP